MPIREFAPLCLARALAGEEPQRLGVDQTAAGRLSQTRGALETPRSRGVVGDSTSLLRCTS